MIEKTRIFITVSLFFIILTLIFHILAMGYDRWKIYEHRRTEDKTIFIGIFHRCENRLFNVTSTANSSTVYATCDKNKYCFYGNKQCDNITKRDRIENMQNWCNLNNNPYKCDYSSITEGVIACTIIAACTLGLSFILIFIHILINQFKYKIHMYVTIVTIILLSLGFMFILITLILLGSTLSYDLYQYRYNLDYRLATSNIAKDDLKQSIINQANQDYDIRFDWAGGLEIIALILSTMTLITQILYLLYIYRNRMG